MKLLGLDSLLFKLPVEKLHGTYELMHFEKSFVDSNFASWIYLRYRIYSLFLWLQHEMIYDDNIDYVSTKNLTSFLTLFNPKWHSFLFSR